MRHDTWPPQVVMPAGAVLDYVGLVVPPRWYECYGQALDKITDASLWQALSKPLGTVTITVASPAVITTSAAHGLVVGDPVYFDNVGTLPTGISHGTTYYVSSVPSSTTFQISATRTIDVISGAVTTGASINTTGTSTGTYTCWYVPYEINGLTQFFLPDYRGRVGIGIDNMGGSDGGVIGWTNVYGIRAGEGTHTLLTAESGQKAVTSGDDSPDHTHALQFNTRFVPGNAGAGTYNSVQDAVVAQIQTGGASVRHQHAIAGASAANGHNTIQPSLAIKKIIYRGAA